MQPTGGVGGQAGQHRLPEERVVEVHGLPVSDEHAGGHGDRKPLVERRLVGQCHGRQIGDAGGSHGQGRRLDHRAPGRGKRRYTVPEQPFGHLVGFERGGVDQLLHQERHSLRQLDYPIDTTIVERCPAVEVAHLVGRFAFVEAPQRDAHGERETGEVGDAGAHVVVRRVRRTYGEEHGQPFVAQRPREIGQQVEAGLVGPVDVLDHDEDGASSGDAANDLGDRGVTVGSAASGFEHRIATGGPELRQ